MNIAFFYIIFYNNYSGDSMNKYEETIQFIDNYAEERGINNRPDALTREFVRKLRKDKNMSYEEQAQNLEAFRQLLNDLGESISTAANILNDTEEENASAGAHLF